MNLIELLVCVPHYKPLPLSPQHESIKGLNSAPPPRLVESLLEYKTNQNPDTALVPLLMITHVILSAPGRSQRFEGSMNGPAH